MSEPGVRHALEHVRIYEYRLRPNRQEKQALMGVLIASREMYNACLEEMNEHYHATGKHLNIYEQDRRHGAKEHPDLPAVVVDTTLKRLHRSFANFFRARREGHRSGFPRFKSAQRWNSIQFRDSQQRLEGNYLLVPKTMGRKIRVVVHRPLEGEFLFARLVLRPSGWYVQCACDVDPKPLPANEKAVGLDMGITYLVADSDGGMVPNPKNLQRVAETLAKAQRRMAKCRKGSRRRRKAVRCVARHHERIANRRKDTLHKISRRYADGYGTIAIEDLKPGNMVRNHSFARAISDASWGMLRSMLEAKAESAGRRVVAVPPQYTSQDCSACGQRVQKSLSVRTHLCPHCGYVADRDTNAALNILKLALRQLGPDGAVAEVGGGV